MKQLLSRLKPYLRWVILGGALIFLAKALKDHWQEVAAIRITPAGWACLAIALGVTLFAHTLAGWVWSWILREFKVPVKGIWVIQVYLKTNIAKYLPGNVWHYYGRISALTNAGASLGAATLSVLLEPLLMAASALLISLLGSQSQNWALQILSLVVVLAGVHPRILNPVLRYLGKLKRKAAGNTDSDRTSFQLRRYPLIPLLGELGFLILRGTGFLLTFLAFNPITLDQLPTLFSGFSFAWLLGLVVPGAPGGVGVFEATAFALLGNTFSAGALISTIAFYRLISIVAEAGGAGLAWLDERQTLKPSDRASR